MRRDIISQLHRKPPGQQRVLLMVYILAQRVLKHRMMSEQELEFNFKIKVEKSGVVLPLMHINIDISLDIIHEVKTHI